MSSIVFVLMVLLTNGDITELGRYNSMKECVSERDRLKVDSKDTRAILCIEGTIRDEKA